jgi:hypothetical protein
MVRNPALTREHHDYLHFPTTNTCNMPSSFFLCRLSFAAPPRSMFASLGLVVAAQGSTAAALGAARPPPNPCTRKAASVGGVRLQVLQLQRFGHVLLMLQQLCD